ncbi:LLM class F420-dependent oxidoreductase [Nocardia araoensis]|uniref:LLM class F420-dependent oxidoreductase n=1 Tax=Nocardia araoensis TaxID=228600 RepID=UPI0002FFDBB3|nr:LLM class F420-dependent oxidoreductase [Nocardia araoensis]
MKLSVYLPTGFAYDFAHLDDPAATFELLTELARAADDGSWHSVYVADHFLTFPPSPSFVFECWTTLAALARETERVRIGPMVTGNGYRNPALQAKMAATLDALSHGRFTFGIGSGWYEEDYRAYGYPFGTAHERLDKLGEALQIIRSMLTEPLTSLDGKHYQVEAAINEPKGVQTPHIPMLIAGGGEKVTLRLVAQYGDACNVHESPDGLRRKYSLIDKHCAAVGRNPDEIWRTSTTYYVVADTDDEARAKVPEWAPAVFPGDIGEYGLIGTPDTIRERLVAYENAGVQELLVSFHDNTNPQAIRDFAAAFLS